ncbi:protein pangolin, isoforms A/H/I/S isoform X3 [Dermacentor andersoni]|uniref:protein pangolin, isoforms A/H/I/S isoform X3 n=1 Tax=Dermacentor andersoni TaxID=34620 RepID=UPI002155D377|nr:protein pangolin, isoforms A/H/I/S-like isoform X3 [Dermacentor andersoni]
MPHGSGGDDLASSDEIKVFKDEGEEEKRSSENLTDLKSSLVTEGEEEKIVGLPGQATSGYASPKPTRSDAFGSLFGKSSFEPIPGPFGYVVPPYHNGALGAAVSMASKGPMVASPHPGSPLNFMVYNEPFSQPPPAHMGIPPVHIDPKTGIPRPSVYPLTSPGQYTHSMFSQEFAQQLHWHSAAAGMYPMPPMASGGFRGGSSYAPPLPRINPPLLPPSIMPHGLHPALVTPGPKQELSSPLPDTSVAPAFPRHPLAMYHPLDSKCNQGRPSSRGDLVNGVSGLNGHGGGPPPSQPSGHPPSNGSSSSSQPHQPQQQQHNGTEKKPQKPTNHVKKPLNAFMLYMKEMRAKVVAECTLKESAAINQILGRRWHSLSREEQSKYYEMARKERQIHMQLYPGWTARDNYAINSKKKKRKKDKSQDGDLNNPKKCRARFGLDQQSDWCKPCRRKKKCIRYQEGLDGNANESEDNIGSVEAPTPESHTSHGGGDTTTTTSTGSPCTSLGTPEPSPGPPVRRADCYSLNKHHPLSVHHLTGQPLVKREPDDPVDILTPPSTDSSTTPSSLPLLTVT